MATPAQHKTKAEDLLADHARGHGPQVLGYAAVMHAHAALAQTLGTGTHYTAADALLDSLNLTDGSMANLNAVVGEQALAHALLADR